MKNMNEILNFVREIITGRENEKNPIGLCGFECNNVNTITEVKPKRKKEMRLSELMDK